MAEEGDVDSFGQSARPDGGSVGGRGKRAVGKACGGGTEGMRKGREEEY